MLKFSRNALCISLGLGLAVVSTGSGCIGQAPKDQDDDDKKTTTGDGDKDDDKDSESATDGDDDKDSDTTTDGDDDKDSAGSAGDDGDDDGGDGGEKGSVTGKVVGPDGEPLEGLSIKICQDACLTPIPTDEDGKFVHKEIPPEFTHYHVAAVTPVDEDVNPIYKYFAGANIAVDAKAGAEVDVGQMVFLPIDPETVSDTLKGVEETTAFTSGKFTVTFNPKEYNSGMYAESLTKNLNFGVIEVPEDLWRDDEKEIDGHELVAAWGMFPYNSYALEDKPDIALSIDDDFGLDDGQELVIFSKDYDKGTIKKAGETKVADGKIELEEGLRDLSRLYITKK